MNSHITRHAVIQGDTPFLAKDTPIYGLVGGVIQYNVAHGQPVAYLKSKDCKIPTAIEVGDLDDTNKHLLRIGVGHAPLGRGPVTGIRHLGSEEVGNCDINDMSVASPCCGNPHVYDMYFDCVDCDTTYTIEIAVRDNFTQSYTDKYKDEGSIFVSYTPNCKQCNDCDTSITCDDVVDGLIKAFRQEYVEGTCENTKYYPDFRQSKQDFPFDVHKIYDRELVYCLSFSDVGEECEECTTLAAFTTATVGGVDVDLSAITTPTDDTALFRYQLTQVQNMINDAFAAADETVGGRAYVTGINYNKCCPLQLHVNTNDAAFAIAGVDPSKDENPFDEGKPGEGFTCGIRVISAPLSEECGCDLNRLLQSYFRKVRVSPIGDGFVDSCEATIQKAEIPAQFGTMIQHQELTQTAGGSGRQYSRGAQRGTWLGNHRDDSHVKQAVTARCEKDYCSYYIRSTVHFRNVANQPDSRIMESYFHVESDAATVIPEVEAWLNKMAELSVTCADVPTVQCTPLSTECDA